MARAHILLVKPRAGFGHWAADQPVVDGGCHQRLRDEMDMREARVQRDTDIAPEAFHVVILIGRRAVVELGRAEAFFAYDLFKRSAPGWAVFNAARSSLSIPLTGSVE